MPTRPQLGPLAHATPEQAARLIRTGVEAGIAALRKQVADIYQENRALRTEVDTLRAEVQRLTAKSAGGAALMPRR